MARTKRGKESVDPDEGTPVLDINVIETPESVNSETVTASEPEAEPVGEESNEPEGPAEEVVQEVEPAVQQAPEQDPITRPRDPVTAAPPPPSRGSALPLFLGGVVAAGLGFGAALYGVPGLMGQQDAQGDIASLKAALDAQGKTVGEVQAALASKPDSDPVAAVEALKAELAATDAALKDSLGQVSARLDRADKSLTAIDQRMTALEKRPAAGGAASATALEAFGREMEAFRAEIETERESLAKGRGEVAAAAKALDERLTASQAATESARQATEEEARKVAARAALGKVEAAIETGSAMDAALGELAAAGVTVPAALSAHPDGAPSLGALQEAFPDAARAAISAALKSGAEGSTLNRIGAFLRSQSQARSLTPREGSDPDAVLSRAEAKLQAGDIAGSLQEIAALPDAGKTEMAAWAAMAQARLDAIEAVQALAAELK